MKVLSLLAGLYLRHPRRVGVQFRNVRELRDSGTSQGTALDNFCPASARLRGTRQIRSARFVMEQRHSSWPRPTATSPDPVLTMMALLRPSTPPPAHDLPWPGSNDGGIVTPRDPSTPPPESSSRGSNDGGVVTPCDPSTPPPATPWPGLTRDQRLQTRQLGSCVTNASTSGQSSSRVTSFCRPYSWAPWPPAPRRWCTMRNGRYR